MGKKQKNILQPTGGFTLPPFHGVHSLQALTRKNGNRTMISRNSSKVRGFTLLETIVSIGILTTGILSIVGLMSYNISQATLLKNRVIATSLAQEGIEIMRNIRDTNWLQNKSFNDWDKDTSSGVFDLSNKLKASWGASYSGVIQALTTDSEGNIYVGTSDGKLGVYQPSIDYFSDLTTSSGLAGYWGASPITGIAIDPGANIIYLAGGGGKFAQYDIDNDQTDPLAGPSSLEAFWGTTDAIRSIAIDTAQDIVYLGGNRGKFAQYDISTGDATDLRGSISTMWGTAITDSILSIALNPATNILYLGGMTGNFGSPVFAAYRTGPGTATNLTSSSGLNSFWGSNAILGLAADSVNDRVFLGGPTGKFAQYNGSAYALNENVGTGDGNTCDILVTMISDQAYNMSCKIRSYLFTNPIYSLYYTPALNKNVYVSASGQLLLRYDPITSTGETLLDKVTTGFGSSSIIRAFIFDAISQRVYMGGDNAMFGFCDLAYDCSNGTPDVCPYFGFSCNYTMGSNDISASNVSFPPFLPGNLYWDSGARLYTHTVTASTTPFSRRMRVVNNPDGDFNTDDVKIVSTVTWTFKGRTYSVDIEERLYDWK